jgi:hypothetical protein
LRSASWDPDITKCRRRRVSTDRRGG